MAFFGKANMNKYLNISCGIDDKFAMPLAVTLYSAIININEDYIINIYIINGGISKRNEDKLREIVRVASPRTTLKLLRLDEGGLAHLCTPGHLSVATYFRLLLPDAMPARESKTIYLDSDMLVQGDLSILWRMDMMGMPIMAVRDYSAPVISSTAAALIHLTPELDPKTPYLNAGIMVMDLNTWRTEMISQKIIKYSLDHKTLYGDQDGINAIIRGRWLELSPLWNVQVYINSENFLEYNEPSEYSIEINKRKRELMRDALVYHFVGDRKPWGAGCALPGQMSWLRALKRSRWFSIHKYYIIFLLLLSDISLRMTWRLVKSIRRRLGLLCRSSEIFSGGVAT